MKTIKAVLLTAALAPMTSISILATPLDITITGTAPQHDWGDGSPISGADYQYEDLIPQNNTTPSSINLAGVNSITVTWNAPAGYMYVVTPPPGSFSELSLDFAIQYGQPGQARDLVPMGVPDLLENMVYGSPGVRGVQINGGMITGRAGSGNPAGLSAGFNIAVIPGSQPFAFTSLGVTADFTGSAVGILESNDNGQGVAQFFAAYFGLQTTYGASYTGPGDPGQLLTLEPIPNGSVPDKSSTLTLAGLGIGGLILCRRKMALS